MLDSSFRMLSSKTKGTVGLTPPELPVSMESSPRQDESRCPVRRQHPRSNVLFRSRFTLVAMYPGGCAPQLRRSPALRFALAQRLAPLCVRLGYNEWPDLTYRRQNQ